MTQKEFEKEWSDDKDYVVCHTSGSTGTPKEIKLSKEFMRKSAQRTNDFFAINSNSHLHTCLDFKYIASKMMTVRADVANCLLTSESPSNRPLAEIAPDTVIALLSVVPSQMQWILENRQKWQNLHNILIGGSPIPSLMRKEIALSSFNAWESYGMTETASHIALRKVEEDEATPFKTLPGISVSLNDNGCLVVNLGDDENVFTTNDLAEVLSPSEFRILGRADNCIISGGVKIIPEQLEKILGSFIAFSYCISSVPDPKWGERLVLVVEKGNVNISDALLKKAVGVRLDQYKKTLNLGVKSPKEIIVVDEFPLTSNGKLDRISLQKLLRNYLGVL